MYVSTVTIIFEKSRTEQVSLRERRTVASFMGKAGRTTTSVSRGFAAQVG